MESKWQSKSLNSDLYNATGHISSFYPPQTCLMPLAIYAPSIFLSNPLFQLILLFHNLSKQPIAH